MTPANHPQEAADPHDLARFVEAQEGVYAQALAELKNGEKQSHWMWFIFPQFDGLGFSPTSIRYAIKSREEALAYLHHPILGKRLDRCSETVLNLEGRSATDIFGSIDALKLRSCATLFAELVAPGSVYERLLTKYFGGSRDEKTLQLLQLKDLAKPQ